MLRLSPNEEARLLADETVRRRRERLAQVRERSRVHASKVLNAVKTEKCKQLQTLVSKIEADWEEEKALRISQLLQLQDACLRAIGQGHTAARNWDPGHEERVRLMMEDNERAEQRHRAALERLRKEQAELDETDRRSELQRSMAREKERLRARRIASLPHRPPDPVLAALGSSDAPRVPADACRWDVAREMHSTAEDAERADSRGYDVNGDEIEPDVIVERASPAAAIEGPASGRSTAATTSDGRKAAVIVEAQLARARDEAARKESERREAARLRHRHALHKEVLHKDYQQMLTELDDLQRADRRRRQQVLERIPRSLYLPPHVVLEKEAERQVEMERQFEELYESVAGNVADVRNLATEVGPLGGTPTASDDTDSATADNSTTCVAAAAPASAASPALTVHPRQASLATPLKDVTNVVTGAPITGDATTRPQQKRAALNKLISRIHDQKSSWVMAQSIQSDDGDETVGSDAADYGRTSPTSRNGKTTAGAPDVERPAPVEHLLSSPGLSTVSSGNVHSSSTDALSTPTLSQYTIESSSDGAGQLTTLPATAVGASRKHGAGLKAEDASKGLPPSTSRLPSAAGELSKPKRAVQKKHDEAERSGDSIDGRNDDGDGDDDDGDDGDDNGGRRGLETEEPLKWIEKQKHSLRQRLDAIAAQRQALENLQTAAQRQLLLASEPAVGLPDESLATSDAGYRYASARERRVREYQQQLLSRGLGSDGRSTLTSVPRRDEQLEMRAISPGRVVKSSVPAPSSTMRSRAAVEIIAPPEQAISSRQPLRLAVTADRAGTVSGRSPQRLSDQPAAGSRRQPEIVTTAPARRSPASPTRAYDHLLSDDASDSWPDSSVDLSSIPGYIPPAQREALLFRPYTVQATGLGSALQQRNEAAAIAPKLTAASSASKSVLTSATSRLAATDASQPLASGTRSLVSTELHLGVGAAVQAATAAPSGTAINGRREAQSYVSIEERERLLADLDLTPNVRRPSLGKFSASTSADAPLATAADEDASRRSAVVSARSSITMATDRLAEQPRPDGKRPATAASTGLDYVGAAGPTLSERISDSRRVTDGGAAGAAVAPLRPAATQRAVAVDDEDITVAAQLNPSLRPRRESQRTIVAAPDSADGIQGDSAAASAILSAALAQQMLERQLAFNDRQEELRRQLAEIQRQKSEILLRYQAPTPTSTAGATYAVGSALSEEIGSRITSTDVAGRTLPHDNRSEPRSGPASQLCEESSALPDEPPSASRHFLSTIEEVDDTESKLESGTESDRAESDRYYDDDESYQGPRTGETIAGALSLSDHSNIERNAERQQAAGAAARYDKIGKSDFQRHGASPHPPAASSSGLSSSSDEHESRQIQDRGSSEAELSSGTLTTTNSSSSAGASSYNPLQLDCSAATITDPSSGSTNDLIIENSLWPTRPYGSDAATAGDRTAPAGYSSSPGATASDATSLSSAAASSSPRASDSTPEAAATSKLVACEESSSSLSSGAGSGSSFRPLALDDSSSNTEKSAGVGHSLAAAGASSESEGSSREPAFEMTDGAEGGACASGEVVSLRYREPNSTSSQEMSISSPPFDALGTAYASAMRPLSEADDADYVDFVGTRPPSSTPMKYPPAATDPRLSEGADFFGDSFLNTSVASSVSSVPDILQEPELTFITMSASSALEESDLPDVTLTPDEQRAQHRDGYSDASDGAAAAAMPQAAAVVPSRLTRSEATIGTARQAGSAHFKTQRTKRLTDAVVVTSSDRKKLQQENRQRTKLLYERLEEVQAQKQAKAREQMRLQAPNRRSEYDAKLKQRKRAAQQAKDSS